MEFPHWLDLSLLSLYPKVEMFLYCETKAFRNNIYLWLIESKCLYTRNWAKSARMAM